MNARLKPWLTLCLAAGGAAVASAAEKAWTFDAIQDVAPPPWAKTAAPGYVSDAEGIACADGNLTFTVKEPHCFFALNVGDTALDAKQYYLLTFRFYSPVSGKITLFYFSPDGEMASMDRAIEVPKGWNDYEVDLRTMTFGQEVHSQAGQNKKYQRWGASPNRSASCGLTPGFPREPPSSLTSSSCRTARPIPNKGCGMSLTWIIHEFLSPPATHVSSPGLNNPFFNSHFKLV